MKTDLFWNECELVGMDLDLTEQCVERAQTLGLDQPGF